MRALDYSWLRPGEQIRYWGEESPGRAFRVALMGGVVTGLLKAGGTVFAYEYTNLPSLIIDGASGWLVGSTLLFLYFFQRAEVILTDNRLIYRRGLILQIWGAAGEVPIAEIDTIAGRDSEKGPLELALSDGNSVRIPDHPNSGQLHEALELAMGPR